MAKASTTTGLEAKPTLLKGFVLHKHEDLLHSHAHTHITHYAHGPKADPVEHLVSMHEHLHNHSQVEHAHAPHEDAEQEHLHEAHVHDHDHPWSP